MTMIGLFIYALSHSFMYNLVLPLTMVDSSEPGWLLPVPMKASVLRGCSQKGWERRLCTDWWSGKRFQDHLGPAWSLYCRFQTRSKSQLQTFWPTFILSSSHYERCQHHEIWETQPPRMPAWTAPHRCLRVHPSEVHPFVILESKH